VAEDEAVFEALARVNTDAIWWILNEEGYPDTFIGGLTVVRPDLKMVGRAVTMRFLPIRPDLVTQVKGRDPVPVNTRAADAARPGDVLVAEMGGELGGGFIGDVILTRFQKRGGVGMVTDGATRDLAVLREMGLAAYVGGGHAAASWRRVTGVDLNVPVRCAGVTVMPGDFLVGDAQGVIAIPAALAADVAQRAAHLEGLEEYVKRRLVASDEPLHEVYPPTDVVKRDYEVSLKQAGEGGAR
jgi:regulator of RNase E activity RraA